MAYNPSIPPDIEEQLLPFLQDEFLRVAQAFNDLQDGLWEVKHKMPPRYKPGTVVYLSGKTGANPLNTGKEGLYRYTTLGTWVYIG